MMVHALLGKWFVDHLRHELAGRRIPRSQPNESKGTEPLLRLLLICSLICLAKLFKSPKLPEARVKAANLRFLEFPLSKVVNEKHQTWIYSGVRMVCPCVWSLPTESLARTHVRAAPEGPARVSLTK